MKVAAGRKKKATKVKTEEREVEKVTAEDKDITLASYEIEGKPVVKKGEAKMLLSLKDRRGLPMVSLERGTEVYQLLLTIQAKGFKTVYDDLSSGIYPSLSYYFLDSMEREKKMYVTRILQRTINKNTSEGIYECKNCKSKKTSAISQYSRGDEPPIQHITCKSCNFYWKDR